MRTNTLLIILILGTFAIGCSKEETELRIPEFETPIITGYHVRNEAGATMGAIGQPNVNLGHPTGNRDSEYFISFFPNPAVHIGSIILKSPDNFEVKKVWLTQAVFSSPFEVPYVSTDGKNNFVAGGAPLIQVETANNNLFLDLTDIPSGYYRLYVSVNDYLFYDNIVIDKDINSTP